MKRERLLGCLLWMAAWTGAWAQVTVMVDPPFQEVPLSTEVLVNVYFSGVAATSPGTVGGALDLTVQFDSTILAAQSVQFYNVLGDPAQQQVLTAQDLSKPGAINIAAVSLLTPAALVALQGPNGPKVKIATLHFQAVGIGFTPVQAASLVLSDGAGKDITPTLVSTPAATASRFSTIIQVSKASK